MEHDVYASGMKRSYGPFYQGKLMCERVRIMLKVALCKSTGGERLTRHKEDEP